ncbi:hypothetical protein ROHU_009384 [Labeo rohita]|uniref:AIG1-type G domain-containing protein n=1 Tax=Labeo rohita TaxID=84645 RepID=A0A498LRB5_LABRO|nr:hypothetical protein ROHU_010720 [Labeo rohita]RXN13887.1 hypothetical protein ROHU_009384 [Labeo rohita]
MIFGKRDKNKPYKTILMVGETGTGKTTLINTMVNHMLGVKKKDNIWFEITDDQSDRTSAHTQTSIVTVYGFYLQESPINLTIIDTPGYGDTRGIELDKEIAKSLQTLSQSAEVINEIHAVCLVIKATQNRLSDRQLYIFNAVQSLFGRDTAENIVLLFTHSNGRTTKNALTAVKEAKIKCAVNDKNQPVYFLFDNCQGETFDDEYDEEPNQKLYQSWNCTFRGMEKLFKFLDNMKPKTLNTTRDVLQQQKTLEATISNLLCRVQITELKQNVLKQTQEALEQNKEHVKNNKNFKYEISVPYKKKVDIDTTLASVAMCCTICEENCHYPGCWWVTDLSWCSVIKDDHCTVCTNKCHYIKHVKEAKIYVTMTKKEKRTYRDLKQKYEDKIALGESLPKKLEKELQELEKEKIKSMIAFSADSVFTLLHIDFLIEKLKEINEPEKAKRLENIKRTGEKQRALGYFKRLF